MTLKLTPVILSAAYSYLRATPPFRSWRLPPADQVFFRVARAPDLRGWHVSGGNRPLIAVSERVVGNTAVLMAVMAHEMVHLHQWQTGRTRHDVHHNRDFHRKAALVCRHHGFDPKQF